MAAKMKRILWTTLTLAGLGSIAFFSLKAIGSKPVKIDPEKIAKVFSIVRDAREAAVHFAEENTAAGRPIAGWQVDHAAREVIRKAGFGKYFVHRTGHNIGEEVHGSGANMDSLETRDIRRIIPHTCFSVEPGIYLPEFGIRSEVDVYVSEGKAEVTGAQQTELLRLLA